MDAIRYAIAAVKQRIPAAILERAFYGKNQSWRRPVDSNIDSQILSTVIRPRVMMDCDIVGGIECQIDLTTLPAMWSDDRTRVYRIPKDRTQGRSIISVLSVGYYPTSQMLVSSLGQSVAVGSTLSQTDATATASAAGMLMNSATRVPITSTASARLVGENTVMVDDMYIIGRDYTLRCVIANDENLNNIQPRSFIDFAKLVEYAVKAYIYNELIVEIGQAELQGGQELGVFKTIVESYSDAAENYQNFLNDTWQAVAFMNDQESWRRHVSTLVGGMR